MVDDAAATVESVEPGDVVVVAGAVGAERPGTVEVGSAATLAGWSERRVTTTMATTRTIAATTARRMSGRDRPREAPISPVSRRSAMGGDRSRTDCCPSAAALAKSRH